MLSLRPVVFLFALCLWSLHANAVPQFRAMLLPDTPGGLPLRSVTFDVYGNVYGVGGADMYRFDGVNYVKIATIPFTSLSHSFTIMKSGTFFGQSNNHIWFFDGEEFSELPVPSGVQYVYVSGINDAGTIVATIGNTYDYQAAKFESGTWTILPVGRGYDVGARDINKHGHIVGTQEGGAAFLYDGAYHSIRGTTHTTRYSFSGINDNGVVLGKKEELSGITYFHWSQTGGIYGNPSGPGSPGSAGMGLQQRRMDRRHIAAYVPQ